jgi:alginate O-acetyltransferase complex protein AlgI
MLFNSLSYWIFLPVVVAIYFMLKHKYRWMLLLVASYVFYAYWNVSFLLLIVISTLVDYWVGLKMGNIFAKKDRKIYLYFSLFVNLGMLFFFKYFGFFNESIRASFGFFEMSYPVQQFDILLPIGISFYTFQTLSYTIDIYRGDRKPEAHLGVFALYISFFPQLVAGPVERSTTFLPQIRKLNTVNWQRIIDGCKLIVWGLFKKMVIGDNLAIFVSKIYDNPEVYSGNMLALATYAFTIQIYCDFSGYTDIAIGSAKTMGFRLSDNFNRPLFAPSMSILWRKWHMTLTHWIRDYFYIPLKNRSKSQITNYLLLYAVFIVIGLWHGAGWQFALYGFIHGTYLTVQRLTGGIREKLVLYTGLSKTPLIKKIIDVVITFNLWAYALISFRSDDLSTAFYIMKSVFSGGEVISFIQKMSGFSTSSIVIIILSTVLLFCIEFINKDDLRNPFRKIQSKPIRWSVYLFVVFLLLIFRVSENMEFYYFQF